jgi:ATP-dependent protease ClpP protease subunit
MQSQIYQIMASRSGRPLKQIIRDTRRVDFYLDAWRAKDYGLIDDVIGAAARPAQPAGSSEAVAGPADSALAAQERAPQ